MANNNDKNVKIVSWPEQSVLMQHLFKLAEPCPVIISFGERPINANISTPPDRPLDVNMNMNVKAEKSVPVCFTLCEPICAQSSYTIDIVIFDRPVATITINGLTKLFNSDEEI